jgi:hypothetical protein
MPDLRTQGLNQIIVHNQENDIPAADPNNPWAPSEETKDDDPYSPSEESKGNN